jgi:hypothetical protein
MEIVKKIIEAKKSFKPVKKDAVNPHFKNRYMTLDDIVESISESLHSQGLVLYHSQTETGLKTILTDGEASIESFYPIRQSLTDQQLGSSLTYGRRYSICCLLGIVADEDDDGQLASKKPEPKKEPTPTEIIESLKTKLASANTFDEVKAIDERWMAKKDEFMKLGIFLKGTEAIDKRLGEIK